MKPRIKVNKVIIPQSWEDLTWATYEKMIDFQGGPIEYFCGLPIDKILNKISKKHFNLFIREPLSFLESFPETYPAKWEFSVGEMSINRKLIAVNLLKKFSNLRRASEEKGTSFHFEKIFPYILAVYKAEDPGNESDLSQAYNLIIDYPFPVVFWSGKKLAEGIEENETILSNSLNPYKIPSSKEHKQAGYEKLEDIAGQLLIDKIAGGDRTKYKEVLNYSVNEVIKYLIMKQRETFHQYQYQKLIEEKWRAKNKAQTRRKGAPRKIRKR